MIELQTSNENALALYSLLSEGQRNGIRVNGTLLSEIRRRGLLVYMNNQCIRSSLYFEDSLLGSCGPNEEMIITDRGSYVLGYIWNIPNPEPKYYVFYRKTLLSLLKSWEEVNEQWIIINENDKCLGYIQNILNYNTKYYVFIEKKLLLTVNLWPEVEKFISSLDKSIMDSVRISHHPNWNGICWNSIKDEKCYMLIYDDDEILFKSEGSSIPFRSDEYWNEVEVVDFKNNLKQIAKLKREINEYCTKYAKDS